MQELVNSILVKSKLYISTIEHFEDIVYNMGFLVLKTNENEF